VQRITEWHQMQLMIQEQTALEPRLYFRFLGDRSSAPSFIHDCMQKNLPGGKITKRDLKDLSLTLTGSKNKLARNNSTGEFRLHSTTRDS